VGAASGDAPARLRLDKWLFHARFAKSRALGAAWAEAGRIRINGRKTDKPDAAIREGDILTLALPGGVTVVRVLKLGDRRGPPAEARALHEPVGPDAADGPAADQSITGTR
jgi:ribosome-associated heat shock protein Hsp15